MDNAAPDRSTSQRDDPRYQRLMHATREAARNGYDAVSMRDLAEACRLSMTTIYQFCQSKDHLIAEAHLEAMEQFRGRVVTRPPKGATAEQRVLRVMRSYAKALDPMRDLEPEALADLLALSGPDDDDLDVNADAYCKWLETGGEGDPCPASLA